MTKAFRVLAYNKTGDMVADFIFSSRSKATTFQEGMLAKGNTASLIEVKL